MSRSDDDHQYSIFYVCPNNNISQHLCEIANGRLIEEWYQDVNIFKVTSESKERQPWAMKMQVDDCDASWQRHYLKKNYYCNYTSGNAWKRYTKNGLVSPISLLTVIWLMAVVATVGNLVVIAFNSSILLKQYDLFSEVQKIHYTMLINLAVADFLVGIHLSCVAVIAVIFPGSTGRSMVLSLWPLCDIMGVISTISSEISVSVLVLITSFRLYSVLWPYKPVNVKAGLLSIMVCWLFWFCIACIPLINAENNDFMVIGACMEGRFPIVLQYEQSTNLVKTFLNDLDFHCTNITNQRFQLSSKFRGKMHFDVARHLKLVNSGAWRINYYSRQTLCTNKYFFEGEDPYFATSILIMLYNFASFVYLFIAYIFICLKTTTVGSCLSCFNNPGRSSESGARSSENRRLQRKIVLIIATDFLCWIPICFISFWFTIKTADLSNPDTCKFYVENKGSFDAFASVMVPINSAINPLLYSSSIIDFLKIKFWNGPRQDNVIKNKKFLHATQELASVSASVQRIEAIL